MRFDFSDDQRLLGTTVREFLEGACPVERIRALWESETGRSRALWAELADIGLPWALVPEACGGLGLDEIDVVPLLEETGRAALAEPVIPTAVVGAPLVRELGLAGDWLARIARGEALIAVGHPVNDAVADAHVADLLLLAHGDEIHALAPGDVRIERRPSNDPARRLYTIEWKPSQATRAAAGPGARELLGAALDRGALACAAEALGVAAHLVELGVRHAQQRQQFGVPIGSFQAVKHMLADAHLRAEYARSLVYRAAHSVARRARTRAADVSMAKAQATEAAVAAAKTSLQVHGAIGYTWECDLHVWMRRAWSLELDWGDAAWHRGRVAEGVIDGAIPAEPFGYAAPSA